jgi:hypothetical protein
MPDARARDGAGRAPPSLAQEDLPKDSRILKALVQHNRVDVAGTLYPCAGVYAVAEATGTIRSGDRVSLV